MRRSMLTAASAPAAFAVGTTLSGRASYDGARMVFLTSGATASRNGVVQDITVDLANAGIGVAFFTCTSGGVVNAISANFTSVAGLSTYTGVNIAIATGDTLGIWTASSLGVGYGFNFGSYYRRTTSLSKPTPGTNVLTGGTSISGNNLLLRGTCV